MIKSFATVFLGCGLVLRLCAAESGDTVLVIYNAAMPSSKEVAQHYAERRNVPSNQILGLNLPENEVISRGDFNGRLLKPVIEFVETNHLFTFAPVMGGGSSNNPASANGWKVIASKIRYAVLCYGVPLRVAEDPSIIETGMDNIQQPLRRNGAAVDAELALLPCRDSYQKTGPLKNALYGATNGSFFHPTNGLLMVARLDGPTPAIASGLVDKAMSAETNGLWGRGYFDARGLTNTAYVLGDEWIEAAYKITRAFGFESTIDRQPTTFPAAFPLSQVALYAGWYDENVSGPFALPEVEFMPGAFAYHLHSYSAATLRAPHKHWAGPLLAVGATATFGYVDEPYLQATSDLGVFFSRWLMGQFSFGEASYAAQPALSWQTTVIGDPLYRPFAIPLQTLHQNLLRRHSKLIEWSHLRVCSRNEVTDLALRELINYLDSQEITKQSAILTEKLGDYYQAIGKKESAARACERALKLDPSPQQKARLTFTLADRLIALGKESEAFDVYQQFHDATPAYPDALGLCQKLGALAQKLNKPGSALRYEAEIKRLTAKGMAQ